MTEQKIGRKRTVKVIDADGNETTTTLQTVGLAKAVSATPAASEPASVPDSTTAPE
jgi:hypothetical protein